MPKLPTAEEVFGQRQAPSVSRQITGYDATAISNANIRAAQGLQQSGDRLQSFGMRVLDESIQKQKEDSANYDKLIESKIKLSLLETSIKNDADFDGRSDYDNFLGDDMSAIDGAVSPYMGYLSQEGKLNAQLIVEDFSLQRQQQIMGRVAKKRQEHFKATEVSAINSGLNNLALTTNPQMMYSIANELVNIVDSGKGLTGDDEVQFVAKKSGLYGDIMRSIMNNMPLSEVKKIASSVYPSNGEAVLLDFIANKESAGDYNRVYGDGGGDINLTGMTVNEVLDWQKNYVAGGSKSSAAGKYQIIQDTLKSLKDEMGLKGNELFDEQMQDKMAKMLLERRGYSDYKSGKITEAEFMNKLSQEWASLPKDMSGKSFYEGDGLNRSLTTPNDTLSAIRASGTSGGNQGFGIFSKFIKGASGDDVMAIIDNVRSKFKPELQTLYNDAVSELEATGETSVSISEDDIKFVFGDDAVKLMDGLDRARTFGKAYSSIKETNINDDFAKIESFSPSGEGFFIEQKEFSALVNAVEKKRAALEDDPYSYVFSNSERVKGAFAAYNEIQSKANVSGGDALLQESSNTAFQYALGEALKEQQRLGVQDGFREVLPKGDAKVIVSSLNSASPEEKIAQVASLQGKYGYYWNDAQRVLRENGLSGGVSVAASMNLPEQADARSDLLLADSNKKAIADLIEEDQKKGIDGKVLSSASKYISSAIEQRMDSSKINDINDAIKTLSLYYLSSKKASNADKAVSLATDEIINKKYNFVDKLRVPKINDVKKISSSLDFVKNDIKNRGVVSPIVGSYFNVEKSIRDEMYIEMLSSGSKFVNSDDDKGVYLTDMKGDLVYVDDGGIEKPLFISFDSLEKMSNEVKVAKKSIYTRSEAMGY